MKRVMVTNPMLGICGMQVCACKDATDDEILATCNSENPAGTMHGWSTVVRKIDPNCSFNNEKSLPVQCADDPERLHVIVYC